MPTEEDQDILVVSIHTFSTFFYTYSFYQMILSGRFHCLLHLYGKIITIVRSTDFFTDTDIIVHPCFLLDKDKGRQSYDRVDNNMIVNKSMTERSNPT